MCLVEHAGGGEQQQQQVQRQRQEHASSSSTYCSSTTSSSSSSSSEEQQQQQQQNHHRQSLRCSTTTPTFNAKYRRKCLLLLALLLFHGCFSGLHRASAYNCTAHGNRCQNDGQCQEDGQCLCADGWQGPECQYCGGKVRMYHPMGTIHDGWGNYSVSVKCSWLIDARHPHWGRRHNASPPRASNIRIHLREFATECGWDHLYIYDGDSVDSPLLAVFSGLMYRGNFSIRRVPQVIARSGTALVHFFSDDAYNMSGFNLTYKMNGCPTDSDELECSGHGTCRDGDCLCDPMYRGDACNVAACPGNCTESRNHGICRPDQERCLCNEGYGGDDCSQISAHGVWSTVHPKHSPSPAGSASHGAAVWRDTLHIIGGESYGRGELMSTYDFNGNVWETVHPEDGSGAPEKRYGASTVMYGDKIFLYGGVVKGQGISNELWAFDVSAKTWELIAVKTDTCNATGATMCGPLRVAGHTATLVPGFGDKNNYQYMVVIFGHSPQYGYLNTVQEFNFGTREWRIVQTSGYVVKGGYGHSSAYDFLTEKVYVYGGIVSESESSQVLSSRLYAYEPSTRIWTILSAAPSARLLHTANFVNQGLMMVFGGNTHNDTSQSYGAKCYSQDLLIYDVYCDSWHLHQMPGHLQADLARFGHSSVVFEDALYIYGGFNGQLLSDILRYEPGQCSFYTKQERCTSARPGVKCIWDVQKMRCISITQVQRSAIYGREQYDYVACPSKSRLTMTSEHLHDVLRCQELSNCQSCVSTAFECTYCGNGVCSKERCRETTSVASVFFESSTNHHPATQQTVQQQTASTVGPPLNAKRLESCPSFEEFQVQSVCEQLHNCRACISNVACKWDTEQNRCRSISMSSAQHGGTVLNNRTLEDFICPPACATLTNCQNCTEDECIWCQNEQRCVDRNAYTASFPYGQCREWTTFTSKCRSTPITALSTSVGSTTALSSAQCGYYNSCQHCLDDPACGWCDNGSNTGLGKCVVGGALAPYDDTECALKHWFFTSCPRCNCNGHSYCNDQQHCEQPCNNLTVGAHCEKCRTGYWGNAINGGECQRCECNNQGDYCHPDTGKCYCSTKGIVGDHCEKCDSQNHYHGDPMRGSCYYELTIDYQFTFNLSKKEDRHFTQINFRNSPGKPEIDADFTITCSVPAKMDISVKRAGSPEKLILVGVNCSTFRHRFPKTEYQFGHLPDDNSSLTTFYVFVHDFQPPIWIQIAFSQYPKLNLQQFFITFSSCFLLLLLMAAVLWKIKQKYDMFRRRQRLFVEMEQMASRPFSQVLVDIENRESIDLSLTLEGIGHLSKKRKRECPSPIALEPCSGNRAAVLSLLVRLPTGGLSQAPAGQSAGLAVASALVTLGNPRRPSMDQHPKEPKSKRKQSQHPDSCI
ncbi:attractin-like protein 1 isoform X2 [Drosophila willistoni]|uniref:attractin-like protein 1 isoform X2 n=1 Tax=Drosophila willistoni TaxID=7260 RepID=UPI000C26C7F7|nr:attractin-like protein 1 isoform X2 [Drosophila willistoni]